MVIVEAIKAVYPQFKEEYKNKKREKEKAKRSKDIKNLIRDLGYEEAIEQIHKEKEAADAEPVEESSVEEKSFSKILVEQLAYNGQVSARGAEALNEKITELKTKLESKKSDESDESSLDLSDDDPIEVVEGEIVETPSSNNNDGNLITPNFTVIEDEVKEVPAKEVPKKKSSKKKK